MALNPRKVQLAGLLRRLRLSDAAIAAQGRVRRHVRAVYYHDIRPETAAAFERQIAWLAQRYRAVDRTDLRGLLDGHWPHDRPGLLVSFDDGLRGHAEIAAPLLEKYGLCGWFFLPGAFLDCPVDAQAAWAAANQIVTRPEAWPDPRVAMTWAQARALQERHVIGCHTWHHVRQTAGLDPHEVEAEIPTAKRRLEARLGRPVESFCWVGGEEETYSAQSARAIRDAGFEFAFMTNTAPIRPGANPLQLQRTHLSTRFSMDVVRLQLSGLMDGLYLGRRRRVNRVTR